MNFFEQQDIARRNTGRLVLLFALAVLCICALTVLLVALLFGFAGEGRLSPAPLAIVALITLAVIGLTSLFKIVQLRSSGGPGIAEHLGGTLIHPDASDPVERKVLNVVEEMAIASGTPVPPVYLMHNERGINAFAAGYTPNDAVIGVTRGCAELLSRDELQAVVAHEFSHIFNGDMRLNIRLIGVLQGILMIGMIGYYILRSALYMPRRRASKESGGAAIALLALGGGLVVIGSAGTFFGSLIKAAVSRQREFLADASAVQFTRNPSGIAGALKKIGGATRRAYLTSPNATQVTHMLFGQGVAIGFNALFATHPPLEQRIRRVEPGWDGAFPRVGPPPISDERLAEARARRAETDVRPAAIAAMAAAAPAASVPVAAYSTAALDRAINHIGAPSEGHIRYAARLLADIPPELSAIARDPCSARAIVFALLLSPDPAVRASQLTTVAERAGRPIAQQADALAPTLAALETRLRLPLIDLLIPTLRTISPEQYASFRAVTVSLIEADRRIEVFEWVLLRIVERHLDAHFGSAAPPRTRHYAIHALADPCEMLLSVLVRAGHPDEPGAQRAFNHAAATLPELTISLNTPQNCNLLNLGRALDELARTAPKVKRRIIMAALAAINADETVTAREAELLRGIADALDCPIPPILATA